MTRLIAPFAACGYIIGRIFSVVGMNLMPVSEKAGCMFDFLKKKAPADRKVMVIGLDCAAPELVFDKFRDELPTLRKLYEGGVWGQMESCIPAITVPAWASMMSSKDPGTLGVYGFRNRRDYTYDNMVIANG